MTSAIVFWCFGQGMEGYLHHEFLCKRTKVPEMLFSALWGTGWGRLFAGSVLFHFTSLRDAKLSNPKCFGKKSSFMVFQNSKHSCQNMFLLMTFYCETEVEWSNRKRLKPKYLINLDQLYGFMVDFS